jgi:hypothetical protein
MALSPEQVEFEATNYELVREKWINSVNSDLVFARKMGQKPPFKVRTPENEVIREELKKEFERAGWTVNVEEKPGFYGWDREVNFIMQGK